jgi:tetratricopeptide (TPR) repeat protein
MLHLWLVFQLAGEAGVFTGLPRDPRLDRLHAWVAAVEQHQPGTTDAHALTLRSWDRAALTEIHEDMVALSALIANPRLRRIVFYEAADPEQRQPRQRPGHTPNQWEELRRLAERIRQRSVQSSPTPALPPPEGSLPAPIVAGLRTITDLLKRGALLHTDVALNVTDVTIPSVTSVARTHQRTTLHLDDGWQQGLDQSVSHLEIARRLLGLVRPNPERDARARPERDAMVRQWYRATSAILLQTEDLDFDHFRDAMRLFPEDTEVLFLSGALHETLAGPFVQDGLRTARLPTWLSYPVAGEHGELLLAEALFRRSLKADPARAETHLRLGRVLGLLGRHREAVKELLAAAGAEPLVEYYRALFLGRELDATGAVEQARASYNRATELFPRAQSPYIALSEAAMRTGDHVTAQSAMQAVWRLSAVSPEGEDPLWNYHVAAGRSGQELLDAINVMFPAYGALAR